jgi:hypothetical protein
MKYNIIKPAPERILMSVESVNQDNRSSENKYKNRLIKIWIIWIKIRFKNINEI